MRHEPHDQDASHVRFISEIQTPDGVTGDSTATCNNCDERYPFYEFFDEDSEAYRIWKKRWRSVEVANLNKRSRKEGWAILVTVGGTRIVPAVTTKFENNEQAQSHVLALAALGSQFHIEAVRFCDLSVPPPFRSSNGYITVDASLMNEAYNFIGHQPGTAQSRAMYARLKAALQDTGALT
jgi:hypothetical protein